MPCSMIACTRLTTSKDLNVSKKSKIFILGLGLVLLLFLLEIFIGSVPIAAADIWSVIIGESENKIHQIIVLESRVPRALTALFAGGGLALSGLLMQRFFHNPLAGPSVLGITSGSSFGVALVVLVTGSAVLSQVSIAVAAFIGAMAVLLLILVASKRIASSVTLLVLGLMIGYMVSAGVTVLQFGATKEALRSFVFWGMGSFSDLKTTEVLILGGTVLVGSSVIFMNTRKLDLFSLGNEYAYSMGLDVKKFRFVLLLVTGVLTGMVTAFCGPIAFIGLAVPHLARGLWQNGKHAVLVPAVVLSGSVIGMTCDLILRLPIGQSLPLNAVTSLFGAPVVIYILLKGRKVF